MVAALVAEAVPSALEGDRLTVAFPGDAAFLKKKAEANRELVLGALRRLTGRGAGRGLRAQRARPSRARPLRSARRSCSSGSSATSAAEEIR